MSTNQFVDESLTTEMDDTEFASPLKNLIGNEYSEDDVYYSNQGGAGTCARHAVAKGM